MKSSLLILVLSLVLVGGLSLGYASDTGGITPDKDPYIAELEGATEGFVDTLEKAVERAEKAADRAEKAADRAEKSANK